MPAAARRGCGMRRSGRWSRRRCRRRAVRPRGLPPGRLRRSAAMRSRRAPGRRQDQVRVTASIIRSVRHSVAMPSWPYASARTGSLIFATVRWTPSASAASCAAITLRLSPSVSARNMSAPSVPARRSTSSSVPSPRMALPPNDAGSRSNAVDRCRGSRPGGRPGRRSGQGRAHPTAADDDGFHGAPRALVRARSTRHMARSSAHRGSYARRRSRRRTSGGRAAEMRLELSEDDARALICGGLGGHQPGGTGADDQHIAEGVDLLVASGSAPRSRWPWPAARRMKGSQNIQNAGPRPGR